MNIYTTTILNILVERSALFDILCDLGKLST